jgi:tRNA1Val (adenine37-N6)-methyltransferase
MKVGTDAVLLGAWTNLSDADRILDIGTGSGVIALMLAQRSSNLVRIDAVEIEKEDAIQARENILHSPWSERILVHEIPIQKFSSEIKYDLIVSNPPYFNNSFQPPDKKRLHTRHTISLDFTELLSSNVILPLVEGLEFIQLAKIQKLFCSRQWSFRPRKEKRIERWLLEFQFSPTKTEEGQVIHYKETEDWTEEYKELTKDFYLKL